MVHYQHLPRDLGIYKITNTINEKIYIGSSNIIQRRVYEHMRDLVQGRHTNSYLQNAWSKYGSGAFDCSVIEIVASKEYLKDREQYWVGKLGTLNRDKGYNIASVDRSKMSDETKAKISEIRKGMKFTEEHKESIRRARLGKGLTEEARRKISEANKGRNNVPRCKQLETGDKNACVYYLVVNPSGGVQVIRNLSKFCRDNNLLLNKMIEVAKGKWGQHRGWGCRRWEGEEVPSVSEPPARKRRARPSQCKNGHLFDKQNTYTDSRGCRHCKRCGKERYERSK